MPPRAHVAPRYPQHFCKLVIASGYRLGCVDQFIKGFYVFHACPNLVKSKPSPKVVISTCKYPKMNVRPSPSSHNRNRAFLVGDSTPSANSVVRLHNASNHTSWLHISLFIENMPKRQAQPLEGASPRGPACGDTGAAQATPVGNHGEINPETAQ